MDYNLWAMIGTWFSGIGVIIAASVSLYLARRSNRVRIRLECGLYTHRISHDAIMGHFRIMVYNIGIMPVTVTDWGIRINSLGTISFRSKAEDVELPWTVNPEQSAFLGVQAHEFIQILKEHQDILPKERLRFYVSTAVGEKHYITSEKTYDELLMEFNE